MKLMHSLPRQIFRTHTNSPHLKPSLQKWENRQIIKTQHQLEREDNEMVAVVSGR